MVVIIPSDLPIWSIVHSSSFQTIVVPNIVSILLLEFVIGVVAKSFSPENKGFFNRESNTLYKYVE